MLAAVTPWFGYLASLCLIIALLVSNDLKFRYFNTAGNIFFITYAIILQAYPVLLTNLILLVINLVYLIKVYHRKEVFNLLEFKGDEKLAKQFLQFYQKDINTYFPQFDQSIMQGNLNFVITRDLVIANMFSASITGSDAEVALNYTVPKYRDYKVGMFLFEKEKDFLLSKGISRIVYTHVYNKNHGRFLKVMGFTTAQINGKNCLVKNL